jgi:hypothetical protein
MAWTRVQGPLLRQMEADAWLVDCPMDISAGEAIENLRDACLGALDRGALTLVVVLRGTRSLSLDALEVLAVVSEILAAREGRLWLACPRRGSNGSYHLLTFEDGDRSAFEHAIASSERSSPIARKGAVTEHD